MFPGVEEAPQQQLNLLAASFEEPSPGLQGGVAGAQQELFGLWHTLPARVDGQHQLRDL